LRTLEYFGGERTPSGELAVLTSLRHEDAPKVLLQPEEAPVAELREACRRLLDQAE